MEIEFIVETDNISIKDYLKTQKVSRRLVTFVKRNGKFLVNNCSVKNHYILKQNDRLVLQYQEKCNDEIIPSFEKVEILYEDEFFLVCNKPSNLPIHPSKKHFYNTLANRLKGYLLSQGEEANIHIVTRLDAETSGLVLCAKSGYFHYLISQDLPHIKRLYLARTSGIISSAQGIIDRPIARYPAPSILRFISEEGKSATTCYQVLKYGKDYTDVSLQLFTGRTHQIRVHLQSINHPIIGDNLYGEGDDLMYLHCYLIQFTHPVTQEKIKIVNYPKWYKEVYDA